MTYTLEVETNEEKSELLIPELPDEITELCLYRIPYPYQSQVCSVSSSWNKAISHPSFLYTKNQLSLSLPYLFVFAFHKSTAEVQWQAMDVKSGRWFVLPPMPCPKAVCPPSFVCASIPHEGKLYVMGGMRSDTGYTMGTMITYCTSTNQWLVPSPMRTPRAFFSVGNINGKIIVVGGNEIDLDVELYDPEHDKWVEGAKMHSKLAKYDAVVVGRKLYITKGWTWPFVFSPRGDRIFVISKHGDCRMKVYHPDEDTWEFVGGERFPCDALMRPFAVSAVEGRIYVVSSGLNVAIGRVFEEQMGKFWVDWEVVEAPEAFHEFSPSNCLLLYA
ncbi:unnamed protein product [Ilex paraguariensis]|uniref:F-box domain-containing protein n=1 Tax=Ilex paraguariensis TaxID=185542 RepID=A0ABC8TI35_9AQUA